MRKIILLLCLLCNISINAEDLKDLRSILDSQKNNSVINIPKGNYLLDLKNGKNAYVFSSLKNVVIDGNGSTVICNRQNQAFQFTQCENVTFKNLIIEYDPPCTSQGTIVAMSGDKKTLTVEIHEGYPVDGIDLSKKTLLYGQDRELIRNFTDVYYNSGADYTILQREPVAKIQFPLNINLPASQIPIKVGDFVSFTVAAEGNAQAHTLISSECKDMKFENITIYDSNSFSFFEKGCTASHYYRCVVTRKIGDPKYKEDRLRAGTADCFHSKFAIVGPTVEECRFEYTGDDCIAINGRFYPVYNVNKQEKSISYLTSSKSMAENYVRVGDEMVCVANDGSLRGKAQVKTVMQTMPTTAERNNTFSKLTEVRDAELYIYGVKVYLESWIEDINIGDVVYSNDRIGRGFKVLRDTVGYNRSRGILLKTSEGIVDGCVVSNTSMSGIVLAPEFYWMEAGCPSNVVVRNNTIEDCMFHSSMPGTSQFAALVCSSQAPNGKFAPAGSLNNISIYNNVIRNCPYPAVGLTSIDGVYFADNIIEEADFERSHGSSMGVSNARDLYRVNVVNFSTTEDVNSINAISTHKDEYMLIIENGYLNLMSDNSQEVILNVYDLSGNLLLSGSSAEDFYVGNLADGLYILNVVGRGINTSMKFILD